MWTIHDIFYVSPLEQNTVKKKQANKFLKLKSKLDLGKDKEYKIEAIQNSAIYNKNAEDSSPEFN